MTPVFPILLPRIVFPNSFNYPINHNKTVKKTEVSNFSWVPLPNIFIYQKWFEGNPSIESNNRYTSFFKIKKIPSEYNP